MTIIQKFNSIIKKSKNLLPHLDGKFSRIQKFNPLFFVSFLVIFSGLFFISSNLINYKNQKNKENLMEITEKNEFSNLTNFFISKINSPYQEINYVIKNNDTVEKILRKFKIKEADIKNISVKLKESKLTNIYSGRKLNLIIKKSEEGSHSVVNFIYPVNNTTSIEIRKSQNQFIIKENILQLYKKEVVVKNTIKNNLYSSAIDVNVEPNIIVEFARIFGFEVDFQRDIRKDDWFEIFYEKFVDDNGKVRDTGKIIYASMYVNGEAINLYNLNSKTKRNIMTLREKYNKIFDENSN